MSRSTDRLKQQHPLTLASSLAWFCSFIPNPHLGFTGLFLTFFSSQPCHVLPCPLHIFTGEPPASLTSPAESYGQANGAGWNQQELTGTTWNRLESTGSIWNWLELTGNSWNWLEPAETDWNWLEPAGTGWNHLDLPETNELTGTSWNRLCLALGSLSLSSQRPSLQYLFYQTLDLYSQFKQKSKSES